LLRVTGLALYIGKTITADERIVIGPETLKSQLSYAIPFGIGGIVTILLFTLDKYTVSAMFGAAGFAIYSVGTFQLPILAIMHHSFADVAITEMARLRTAGKTSEIVEIWQQTTIALSTVFFPAFIW